MNPDDEAYFERLEARLDEAMNVAGHAKAHSGDPRPEVEIPIAKDMADRVENLLGIDGVAERVRELDAEMSREAAALALAEDFAAGLVGDYETDQGKIEGAVRTAVALLTEGVVAAPIEGIDRVEVSQNDDETSFVRVYYAGPIRSAGGTAQALSVLVADYTRALLGLDRFKPRNEEIERYAEEVALYDRESGLQYSPKDEETKFIARHCPVMLDGEATGDEEVSGYRDLERVATNNPRGGMCLVLAEGIALKAPKIKRYTAQLEEVEWPWLDDLIDGAIGDGHDDEPDEPSGETADDTPETDGPVRVEPASKYLRDLIAGRPVFTHPSRPGGFRLRYGRARNHGFATAGIHPATMHVLDDFVATGTQIKTERPGKAAGVVPVDSIDGPTVKLANGDVRHIDDVETALELRNGIVEILDVGEYLVNYGEFVENNHALAPASYVTEWWLQDLAATDCDVQALLDAPDVDLEHPTWEQAFEWTTEHDAPLHPAYTYLWHDIDIATLDALVDVVETGEIRDDVLVLDRTDDVQRALEHLLVEHRQRDALFVDEWRPLVTTLGFDEDLTRDPVEISAAAREWPNAHKAVNELAPFTVQERAPTRIGNRMGRPEKSEKRELSPAVHALFPIGDAGGSQRDFSKAANYTADHNAVRGAIETEIGVRACEDCDTHTFRGQCSECGGNTYPHFTCPSCDRVVEPDDGGRVTCEHCDVGATNVERRTINLNDEYRNALDRVGERESAFSILKGVKGLMSKTKPPEPIEKGVLRAKHGVSTFKDGTVRYDMTDLPVTAVRPRELDVTVDHFRELGYTTDVHGDPLEHDDQLVELRIQDIVLSDGAADHLLKTAAFVDDLLEQYYDADAFYNFDDRDDLVGELVFGMAPHTSAAVVGRVVGFTSAAVGYAHPYFHAAKRRNCFHPGTKLWYEDETGEWHRESIETFVEERLEDPETDDFGALVTDLDDDTHVPSVTADGESVVRPVEAVSKHPAPDHLLEIRTRGGRELTVTPDHSMRRWTGNRLERVRAHELAPGDTLPTALHTRTRSPNRSTVEHPMRVVSDGGDVQFDDVASVEIVDTDVPYTYSLTVTDTNTLVANDLYVGQCDGDEDCVMLLMDGLLNFSKEYLPDRRGGKMDAALVMSSRIDPNEIDDEAHNMDIVNRYPREFYEATRRMADPGDIDIRIAEDTLDTDDEYRGFAHTHDTTNIAAGPALSAYKTLGSMMDKMNAQLELARKLRAVDETDVAERVIESHFLPDLIGNLRAFSRQETRCLNCGEKYRRVPLTGTCRLCGGTVNLTVHHGSVNKYMQTALDVADEYGAREYTKQRLKLLERNLESIFEDDTNKQSGIADFM